MTDRVDVVLTDAVLAEIKDAAYDVLDEHFGMPYAASVRDYPNLADLQRADHEADAKNAETVALVVDAILSRLKANNETDKSCESQLKSVEYHLDVAKDLNRPAVVVNLATSDLINRDVPLLLALVRSQAAELQALREDSNHE